MEKKLTTIVVVVTVLLLISSFLIFALPNWGKSEGSSISVVGPDELCDAGTKNCIDSCNVEVPATCDLTNGKTTTCDCEDPLNQI